VPFSNLSLSNEILQAVEQKGYTTPTPIQQEVIPAVFRRRDILAVARTGTGKTAGYTLPMLEILQKDEAKHGKLRALVLVPTRELARQVNLSINEYAHFLPLRCEVIYGGKKMATQIAQLAKKPDILVATTGRLVEHLKQGNLSLDSVDYLVLDEADIMLDMGFVKELESILEHLPKKRQTLLFSATLSKKVKRFTNNILHRPQHVELNRLGTVAPDLKQKIYLVDEERKSELISYLIGFYNFKQVLLFCRTKASADEITKYLNDSGLKTLAIHGDKSHGERTKGLKALSDGSIRVLVATDIAARGIDIETLPYVFNYDIPSNPEDFIHRVGRTSRAGHSGTALSFVCADEQLPMKNIENLLQTKIERSIEADFEPLKTKATQNKIYKEEIKKRNIKGAFGNKKRKVVAKKNYGKRARDA
jgi:ATP-dependent RNA helicase RhlE